MSIRVRKRFSNNIGNNKKTSKENRMFGEKIYQVIK